MIGQTVSHYRIIEKHGGGGMGEVYRAADTNLHRHVAIKVLPDEFSHDPERLARFQREAQVLASLNHPNIATLCGLEESDGKRFIVMELVEGQTLAQRLQKGPLPLDEALDVCRQIAEGLEAAHEKGVIHRDLKPANIQLTPDGKVKILDFGLARAFHDQPSEVDQTHSPTITEAMTRPGIVLGTAAYMSPEQAKGKPVGKRADIWAFGCVLYECLTGKRAFEGESVTETLARILEGAPDWEVLPGAAPQRVRELLSRCLQRNLRERLHDIGDARIELEQPDAARSPVLPFRQRISLRSLLATAAGTLATGLLGGALLVSYLKPPASQLAQPVIRAALKVEPGYWLDGARRMPPYSGVGHPTRTAMCLSSDGRFVVYSAIKADPTTQDKPRLYLRRLDRLDAAPITGTEGGVSPFLSPDDRWVGFWADGKLKKVSVDGGVSTAVCDVAVPYGFSWGTDNQIVLSSGEGLGLSRDSADGGKPETLTQPDRSKEEYSHRLPHCLPAGSGILFTIMRHGLKADVRR